MSRNRFWPTPAALAAFSAGIGAEARGSAPLPAKGFGVGVPVSGVRVLGFRVLGCLVEGTTAAIGFRV